jgi:hypothetical protein
LSRRLGDDASSEAPHQIVWILAANSSWIRILGERKTNATISTSGGSLICDHGHLVCVQDTLLT